MRTGQQVIALTSRLRRFVVSSDLLRAIGRGVSWMGIGAVGSRALTITASIVISRLLGVDGFGRYGMIQTTLGTFGVFAGAGLGMTVTKFVAGSSLAADAAKAGEIIGLVLLSGAISGAVISVAAFFLAPWLSAQVLADPELEFPLRICAALLFLGAVNGVQFGALAGMQAFKTIAFGNVITNGITALCSMIGAYTAGLDGACIGLTVGGAANCVVGRVLVKQQMRRNHLKVSFSGIWQHRGILLSFSLPALLSSVLVDPVNWICAALLVNQPNGYHDMGAFSAANQWLAALLFIPNLIGFVIFPRLSQAFAEGGRDAAKILALGIGFNAAVTIPLVLILSLGSASIMGLYSPILASEWQILVVTLITGALVAMAAPVGHVIAASGRMWTGMALNSAWAVSYIGLTMLLLPGGALGLAYARAIAYGLHVAWSSVYAVWLARNWTKAARMNRAGDIIE